MVQDQIDGHNDLARAALGLLKNADRSWTSITGQLYTFSDEDVRERAREWFLGEHTEQHRPVGIFANGELEDEEEEGVDHGIDADAPVGQLESTSRVFATASPWRMRIERRQYGMNAKQVFMPDLLIADDRRWWVDLGDEILAGKFPPDRVLIDDRTQTKWAVYGDTVEPYDDRASAYGMFGGQNLEVLLKPSPVVRAFDFRDAAEADVEGRRAIRLRGRMRDQPAWVNNQLNLAAAALAERGAGDYVFMIDAIYGIVLAWEVRIGGQVARRQSFSELRIDVPIDPALFSLPAEESITSLQEEQW